ncbi:MAG TPA: sigma-70 family RNA polymerase sigma factor [Thermoanaerobaculia bacterium]|jgi:RNA polymerase sigma factor for flagellar operon FliA|nr:sigma-70 family RNA polymerase sigma factor [Thermoanaerobaculia bacterium]
MNDVEHAGTAELFRDNLALIDRVVARVCRLGGVQGADADDFSSSVKLALLENDYAVLRGWQQRSSLATYLTVVVQRLLSDQRVQMRGRWEPSAAARRGGPAAIALETAVLRDGQSLEQALPRVQALDPSLRREHAEVLLASMPMRTPRLRAVELDAMQGVDVRGADTADGPLMEKETQRLSMQTSTIVREVLASMSAEDRTIIRSHFGTGMSIADIARMMRLPQRPLYRRIESITAKLRRALMASGIDEVTAESLIGASVQALDFGLTGKNEVLPQSRAEGESR